ncbi:MAG: DUF5682 family protein [Candidatus Heimdallarchaeaceae archaeon]
MSNSDPIDTVEGVKDRVEKIMDDEVIYFPIRHHSVACSFYLEKHIEKYKPTKILIELPSGAETNLKILNSDQTKPPIALHSFFVDKKNEFELNGVLSPAEDIPVRFEGYHPMVSYSPEFRALKIAKDKGIEVEFIDLPLRNLIPYRFKQSPVSLFYPEEKLYQFNIYGSKLAQKLRCRNFHEVWELMFETNLSMQPEEFVKRVLSFGLIARQALTEDFLESEGAKIREAFMKFRINRAYNLLPEGDRKNKILVVSGAFHSVTLPFIKGKKQAIRKSDNVFITVPYTYDQIALSKGYSSGNPAPRYYDKIWQNIKPKSSKYFDDITLSLALEVKNQAREFGSVISVADSIHAFRVAKNLGKFRGKENTGFYDLADAIETVYIKGDDEIYGQAIHRAMDEIFIGNEFGEIDPSLSTTPLLADFQYQAKKLRINLVASTKLLRVNLYQKSAMKQKSQFLHQNVFLNTGFAEMAKGPNLAKKEDMHLLAEQWNVAYSRNVELNLIRLVSLGNTVRNACLTLLKEKFASTSEAGAASELLLNAAQMGLIELLNELGDKLIDIIDKDQNFKSLVQALYQLVSLYNFQESLLTEGYKPLLKLIHRAYVRAAFLIPTILTVSEEEEEIIIEKLKALTNFVLSFTDLPIDKDLYVSQIESALKESRGNFAVRGSLSGVLYSFNLVDIATLSREINGYSLGGSAVEGGNYLYGLFTICREIMILRKSFFTTIDELVCSLTDKDFLSILPILRRSFSLFSPKEIDIIAANVAKKRDYEEIDRIEISEKLANILEFADQIAEDKFGEWGL